MNKEAMGYLGPLAILRDHLIKHGVECHPFLDYLSGNISTQVYVPSLYIPGTNIIKPRYQIGS